MNHNSDPLIIGNVYRITCMSSALGLGLYDIKIGTLIKIYPDTFGFSLVELLVDGKLILYFTDCYLLENI